MTKLIRLIALGIGMSATAWLTISMILIHLGAKVQLVEDVFIVRVSLSHVVWDWIVKIINSVT